MQVDRLMESQKLTQIHVKIHCMMKAKFQFSGLIYTYTI